MPRLTKAIAFSARPTSTPGQKPFDRPTLHPRCRCIIRQGGPLPMNAPRNTQYRYLETHRIAGSCGAEVVGRRPVRGSARRRAGGSPRRAARQLRDLLPRPEAHARAAASLRPPLGRDPSASVHAGYGRTIRRSSRSSRRPRTRRTSAAPGTPIRCSRRSRRWARSCTRWKCRRPAATRCSPTSTSPTRACPTA